MNSRFPPDALQRLEHHHLKNRGLGLDRIRAVLGAIGDPQRALPPVIHVAGTNGKGSTVAFLTAMAQAAGLRAHVYTSPHLVDLTERFRIAGRLISPDRLDAILNEIEAAPGGGELSLFELWTAAAFRAFAEVPADVCILEVGLGGRLDATNVIARPAVTVIAPVDLDHREFLGDTIAAIAGEKAGILKPDAPAVIGVQPAQALEVIMARIADVGARAFVRGRDWRVASGHDRFLYGEADAALMAFPAPSLSGRHQLDNAALAVAAMRALDHPAVTWSSLAHGVAGAVWPARLQRLKPGPLTRDVLKAGGEVWLDGGHNPHAGRALAEALAAFRAQDGMETVLVTGMQANKDREGFLSALAPEVSHLYAVAARGVAAAAPQEIVETAESLGLSATACTDLHQAMACVVKEARGARVLVCGSLYLAGEVLAANGEAPA